MQLIPLVVATLVSFSAFGGADKPSYGASHVSSVRVLEVGFLPLDHCLIGLPVPPPPLQNPIAMGLQETGIDEEDNDTLEKPIALDQTFPESDLSLRILPSLGPSPERAVPGTMTVPLVLRC